MINVQIGGSGLSPKEEALRNDFAGLFDLAKSVSEGVKTYNDIGETAAKLEFQSATVKASDRITELNTMIESNQDNPSAIRQYQNEIENVTRDIVTNGSKFSDHKAAFDTYNNASLEFGASIRSKYTPLAESMYITADDKLVKNEVQNQITKFGSNITKDNIDNMVLNMSTRAKDKLSVKDYVEKSVYGNLLEEGITSINGVLPEDIQQMVTNTDGSYNEDGAMGFFNAHVGSNVMYSYKDEQGNVKFHTESDDPTYEKKASDIFHKIASAYKPPKSNLVLYFILN